MATGQGAAGVRVEIDDRSEYQIVNEPLITAGIVGFSSKGPLNKIINLSSSEKMDSVLGTGYNYPKFNQGLYAARGILNARGNVEFVRPFGESIVTDDTDPLYATSQELKSDAFVVNYDFSESADNSLTINHYAATRYVTDGMAVDYPGSSRKINRISDAIVENTNVDFKLDVDADGASIPLFAIINEDPTAAIRGEASDLNLDVTETGKDYLSIKTASNNTASKCTETLSFQATPALNESFTVTRIDGSKVTFEFINHENSVVTDINNVPVKIASQLVNEANVTCAVSTKIKLASISGYKKGDDIRFSGNIVTNTTGTGLITATGKYTVIDIVGDTITLGDTDGKPIDTSNATANPDFAIINMALTLQNIATEFDAADFGIDLMIKNASSDRLIVTAVRGVRIPSYGFTTFFDLSDAPSLSASGFTPIENTVSVLVESSIGRKFVQMGLANESYIDIDFDGVLNKTYTLTSDGLELASLYLDINYYFSGKLYNFSGTIVPYVFNDQNTYIGNMAASVENGFKFIINDNIALSEAAADSSFDFTTTRTGGLVASKTSKVAYDDTDPAITNSAIWSYDPRKNNGSQILSGAWDLFLKKDQTVADMLVAAGTAVKNLFTRGAEEIDYNVMTTMLTICEKRKDCFAIFDGVDETRIDTALFKMQGIGSQGNDIGRWGAIYDGRSMMNDTVYTKLNVEVVKSIEVSQIIAFNRSNGVYWMAPAGFQSGRVPSSMASRQKYIRSYGYGADDANSDIALLYDANINPTRVTQAGSFLFGQKTMLRRNTALNRLNVIMLIAGIHRRFVNYLDDKTFQLNTAQLRNNIQAELQMQINAIKTANPAGLVDGKVICNETNNSADVIDRNELIVDVRLKPTRAAEFITLRTTVLRTSANINTSILGG